MENLKSAAHDKQRNFTPITQLGPHFSGRHQQLQIDVWARRVGTKILADAIAPSGATD